MDTTGTINSDFSAIEAEERRLNALSRQIEDPEVAGDGLTFIERIFDLQQDKMNGKLSPSAEPQFRVHRRVLKNRYKNWKKVNSQLPPQYTRALLKIQLNNPDLYGDIQEVFDNALMIGTELILNVYSAENKPLSWHLDEASQRAYEAMQVNTRFLEKITIFRNTLLEVHDKLDAMANTPEHATCYSESMEEMIKLCDTVVEEDKMHSKLYYEALSEFVDKEVLLKHRNSIRQKKYYDARSGKDELREPLKLVYSEVINDSAFNKS